MLRDRRQFQPFPAPTTRLLHSHRLVITWIVWVPRAFNVGRFFDTDVGEILGSRHLGLI
jgi:hypothetical protein